MRFKFAIMAAIAAATLVSTASVGPANAQVYYGGRPYYHHHHHWRDRGSFGLSIGTPTYYGGPSYYGAPAYYGCPYGYPGCYQPSYYSPYYNGGANFSLSVPIR